jgi:UV DNA damage endonuclease
MAELGLVCLTVSGRCRYRSITRARWLTLGAEEQRRSLERLYWDNLGRFHNALTFCAQNGIRLYRVTSSLFPLSDEGVGSEVLESMPAVLSSVGRRADRLGIRVVIHPDQFVVLSSESEKVVRTSVRILEKHARAFDLMGFPRSPWAAMNIHGGKAGRAEPLIETIRGLPESVRSRLTLENDERAYGAGEILDVCRRTGVPMIFDNLHHVVHEGLGSYDDPSVGRYVRAAAGTWPRGEWQIVHLSNGMSHFADPRHSELITDVPKAYRGVPWIEVEAKGKECAIAGLRGHWKRN